MITGKNIILRGLELSDVPELMKHWNNRELKQFLHAITPHSFQEEEEWVRKTWEKRNKGESFVFAIVLVDSDLFIGNVEVTIMDSISRRGNLGIAIFNPDYWSKGHGTEAIGMILNYAFFTLNLHTVELSVFANNPRAQRSYEKNGFKKTGVRREALYIDGTYFDIFLLDITKKEWKEANS